jgi:hypothetical protein
MIKDYGIQNFRFRTFVKGNIICIMNGQTCKISSDTRLLLFSDISHISHIYAESFRSYALLPTM